MLVPLWVAAAFLAIGLFAGAAFMWLETDRANLAAFMGPTPLGKVAADHPVKLPW